MVSTVNFIGVAIYQGMGAAKRAGAAGADEF